MNTDLQKALNAKGPGYKPRTEHIDEQGRPLYTNRLILEDSPYLLQHAHNPVDWYPWGKAAFAKAKKEGKPIFLSIGYSTCHWCHVMEKESFENLEIAQLLNENFVAIKVDRERRPDVDETYMNAVMLITGRGGWPMSSFLTPEGKTFFGGTYYPPTQFKELLQQIVNAWTAKRPLLVEQANNIAAKIDNFPATHEEARALSIDMIPKAITENLSRYDEEYGGFGPAPKFPNEPLLFLLLNYAEQTSDQYVMETMEKSLAAMAQGGIYDQIGGGFHRYSTDKKWLVPHFEKMLYNQANISRLYIRAWRLTANPFFERVTRETLDFVLREMTADHGGFYSSFDADSEGEEGLYYLWTSQQINETLGADDAMLARDLYSIHEAGNFQGSNILTLKQSLEDYAMAHGLKLADFINKVNSINQRLQESRQHRIHPLRDDKIITSWNGMMITAFAQTGNFLNEPRYIDAAVKAGEFIWNNHRTDDGNLWRATLEGKASVEASQEDYAYLAESFLMLFDVTEKPIWLERARQLTDVMLSQFWDQSKGGFFMGIENNINVAMGRVKDSRDSAIPSGNAVALHVLQKLTRRTDNPDYEKYAERILSAFSSLIRQSPSAFAYTLSGANDLYKGESGSRQYAARGAVTVSALQTGQNLTLSISLKPNWHINAHHTIQADLIATDVRLADDSEGWKIENVEYPNAKQRTLGFQKEPLALYEGQVNIKLSLKKTGISLSSNKALPVELILQACNEKFCLPPETLRLLTLMPQQGVH